MVTTSQQDLPERRTEPWMRREDLSRKEALELLDSHEHLWHNMRITMEVKFDQQKVETLRLHKAQTLRRQKARKVVFASVTVSISALTFGIRCWKDAAMREAMPWIIGVGAAASAAISLAFFKNVWFSFRDARNLEATRACRELPPPLSIYYLEDSPDLPEEFRTNLRSGMQWRKNWQEQVTTSQQDLPERLTEAWLRLEDLSGEEALEQLKYLEAESKETRITMVIKFDLQKVLTLRRQKAETKARTVVFASVAVPISALTFGIWCSKDAAMREAIMPWINGVGAAALAAISLVSLKDVWLSYRDARNLEATRACREPPLSKFYLKESIIPPKDLSWNAIRWGRNRQESRPADLSW